MATVTLSNSSWTKGTIRVTYTASNGTLKITEIEGKRGDGYRSYNSNDTAITVSVGGTSKSISLSHYVDFGASGWVKWGATDTSWTGLTGTSIKISTKMQSGTPAYSGYTFSGNATMSWTKYTITYNANGGSLGSVPSTQTKTYGTALTLTTAKPTKSGYTFSKWNTKSDGSGTSYNAGASYTANAAATLYAIWTENKLTVNYYSNYATYGTLEGTALNVSASTNVKVNSQEFLYDNAYSSGLANIQNTSYLYLSRIGYTPTGNWGTSTSGGNLVGQDTSFSTGQALAKAFGKDLTNGNASVNIYPQWQINTYTINYNAYGGYGSMSSQTVDWQETFSLYDNTFKREGYKFIGWNVYRNKDDKWYVIGQGWVTEDEILANGYEKKLYDNQSELIFDASWIKGDEYSISEYTLYAIWEISGIVYIDNGTTFEPYLAYIDNGTSWDLYLMYVDDGTNWNIIS